MKDLLSRFVDFFGYRFKGIVVLPKRGNRNSNQTVEVFNFRNLHQFGK